MTKGCKILSIELPEEAYHQLTSEAQAPPFLGNRSRYARGILEQRHEKTISIPPQAQALTDHHEQQLAQQAQDHQRQLDELAQDFHQQLDGQAEDQQQALDELGQRLDGRDQTIAQLQQRLGLQQREHHQLKQKHTVLEVNYLLSQYELERKAKELAERRDDVATLTRQLNELQKQYKERKGKSREQLFSLVTGLMEKGPSLVDDILSGLGGQRPAQPTPELRYAIKLGQGIIKAFPEPELDVIMEFLCYLSDTPPTRAQLLAQPEFKAYQAAWRTKATGQPSKSQ